MSASSERAAGGDDGWVGCREVRWRQTSGREQEAETTRSTCWAACLQSWRRRPDSASTGCGWTRRAVSGTDGVLRLTARVAAGAGGLRDERDPEARTQPVAGAAGLEQGQQAA
eukprot:2418877-Rhodomonas_salina.1